MRRKAARGVALLVALVLVASGLFALVTTSLLSRETTADQLGTFEAVVLLVLATAGSGSALWAVGVALLGLVKMRDMRLYANCIAAAAVSYAGWVAFAFYLLWKAVSLPPG